MPHRIERFKDAKYIKLSLIGELTRADHETARSEAARVLTECGWDKLLIEAKMSILDNFEFTRDHKLHFPEDLQTAIIYPQDKTKSFKFIENTAQNRGMKLKLFTDESLALDWLL